MHMYVTSALQKTDMKAVMLQLAMDLHHKKVERDIYRERTRERESNRMQCLNVALIISHLN